MDDSVHPLPPQASRQRRSKRTMAHITKQGREGSLAGSTRSNDTNMARRTKKPRRRNIRPPSPPSQNKPQTIEALPTHIISNILFGYLDQTPKQQSIIRSVCRSFRAIAMESFTALDRRPDITRKVDFHDPLSFDITHRFTNLQEIDISFCSTFADRDMVCLLPLRTILRVLKLRGTLVSDEGVISYFEHDKCLAWYEMRTIVMMDSNSEQVTANKKRLSLPIEVLDLSKTKPSLKNRITNKSALAVAYCCPVLKKLSLSMCTGITDDFLESVPLFLPKLSSLDVSMTSITSLGCCHLARLPALREVDISACPRLSGQAIKVLIQGKIGNDDANDVDGDQCLLERLGMIRGSATVSQLRSIAARFTEGIDATLLNSLGDSYKICPHLRTLDLRHYRGNDFKTGFLSPIKLSLRKLRQNGVEVAISRVPVQDES